MITIEKGATVTILDSSATETEEGTGKIINTGYMINPFKHTLIFNTTRDVFWVNDGNLVVYGGTIQGGRQKDYVKSNFSWDKFKDTVGAAVELGVAVTDYATGIKGAKAAKDDLNEAIKKAEEMANEIPNSFIAGQFVNPANPQAHYCTTGPEIWEDTDGNVDIFVAGVGTGGTITGTGEYLKSKNEGIKIVGIEPCDSPVLSGGKAGPHPLQGIGAGFIPEILNTDILDEIVTVSGDEAFESARLLATKEGVLVGISSGAALHTAIELAKKEENKDKNIVVLLPDLGDRYLSTDLF
jgi:cysteine synthase